MIYDESPPENPPFEMPATTLMTTLGSTASYMYRPMFGGVYHDQSMDADVLEFTKLWFDCVHGTKDGIYNLYMAVKAPMAIVPFQVLSFPVSGQNTAS